MNQTLQIMFICKLARPGQVSGSEKTSHTVGIVTSECSVLDKCCIIVYEVSLSVDIDRTFECGLAH